MSTLIPSPVALESRPPRIPEADMLNQTLQRLFLRLCLLLCLACGVLLYQKLYPRFATAQSRLISFGVDALPTAELTSAQAIHNTVRSNVQSSTLLTPFKTNSSGADTEFSRCITGLNALGDHIFAYLLPIISQAAMHADPSSLVEASTALYIALNLTRQVLHPLSTLKTHIVAARSTVTSEESMISEAIAEASRYVNTLKYIFGEIIRSEASASSRQLNKDRERRLGVSTKPTPTWRPLRSSSTRR